jgi:AcrR family transcriptional regulator
MTGSSTAAPINGRKAQAARNDKLIMDAARAVFIADPTAPISAVAERANVGISALYRRYPSKEELLRKLCADGLRGYITAAREMLADEGDPWDAFVRFMRAFVDAEFADPAARRHLHPDRRPLPRSGHGATAQRTGLRPRPGGRGRTPRPRRQRHRIDPRTAGEHPPRRRRAHPRAAAPVSGALSRRLPLARPDAAARPAAHLERARRALELLAQARRCRARTGRPGPGGARRGGATIGGRDRLSR